MPGATIQLKQDFAHQEAMSYQLNDGNTSNLALLWKLD